MEAVASASQKDAAGLGDDLKRAKDSLLKAECEVRAMAQFPLHTWNFTFALGSAQW